MADEYQPLQTPSLKISQSIQINLYVYSRVVIRLFVE